MAKISTLTDDFNDNSLNTTLWTNDISYLIGGDESLVGTLTEVGGKLEILQVDGALALISKNDYDFQDSSIYFELSQIMTSDILFIYIINSDEQALSFLISWEGEDCLLFPLYDLNDGSGNQYAGDFITYNSTNHKFLRIRDSSSVWYWDVSSDGISWNNVDSCDHSALDPQPDFSTSKFLIYGGTDSSTPVIIDNVNPSEEEETNTTNFFQFF